MLRFLKWIGGTIGFLAFAFAVSWVIFMPSSEERGVWRLTTGGNLLELTPFSATLYTESSHSCFEDLRFPAHLKLVELAEGAVASVEDGRLRLKVDGSLDPRFFERIEALPAGCGDVPATTTPQEVFRAIWTAMHEHYAFFDLHGVDWSERASHIPASDVDMTDEEMRQGILAMMKGLDDGHVHFGSPELGYASPAERPSWIPEDGTISRNSLMASAISVAGVPLKKTDGASFLYGLRPDGIGYIYLEGMSVDTPFGGNSTAFAADIFESIRQELADARALIIDVRYNPGGSDTVSFGIAGQFTEMPQPVFTKTTRVGDQQTAPFTAVLQPTATTTEDRPTVVLTSRLTGSAAEIFTLAMREMPNVVVMGEPTSGGLSDVMGFKLPNGWGLGLSNQTYLSIEGEHFEARGVPPDVPLTFETLAYAAGDDPVLQDAIAYLSENAE